MRRDIAAKWIVVILLLVILLSAFRVVFEFATRQTVHIGGQAIKVRLANTPESRERGLSGTDKLASKEGLLLVFDHSAKWDIWMKDMHYNIDVVWLDADKKVVDVLPNLSPDTYPHKFQPQEDARYVLELPAGFAAQYGVMYGTLAVFDG